MCSKLVAYICGVFITGIQSCQAQQVGIVVKIVPEIVLYSLSYEFKEILRIDQSNCSN
jgi:hypothetical protein